MIFPFFLSSFYSLFSFKSVSQDRLSIARNTDITLQNSWQLRYAILQASRVWPSSETRLPAREEEKRLELCLELYLEVRQSIVLSLVSHQPLRSHTVKSSNSVWAGNQPPLDPRGQRSLGTQRITPTSYALWHALCHPQQHASKTVWLRRLHQGP